MASSKKKKPGKASKPQAGKKPQVAKKPRPVAKPSKRKSSSTKRKKSSSKAAVERERAQAARTRFLQEKKRQLSSRKGWVTRRTDSSSLYRQMETALDKYMRTHLRKHYSQFRSAKRNLYENFPRKAYDMVADAVRQTGWSEQMAAKFAKLS